MHRSARAAIVALVACLPCASAARADSTCHGTASAGRLEDACRLPLTGDNFSPYSRALNLAGRTWVHCAVAETVVDAYAALAESLPGTVHVYGETGKREGGPFPPHRTHRNGTSVDFMVPVRDADGDSVPLPTWPWTRFGYDLEFTLDGRLDELTIDFEALTAHLAALVEAGAAHGIGVRRVIFDPKMQGELRSTRAWLSIESLAFTTRRSWVRHDDHYHVDFDVPCEPG